MSNSEDINSSITDEAFVQKVRSRVWRQHVGAFTACLSAFIVGNAFGWSSFAQSQYLSGSAGFMITKREASIMESLLTFSAAISCFPVGWTTDRIGRKATLLATAPLSLLGWCLIIWSNSINMLYAGRLLLGLSAGISCIVTPVYVSEICQKEIRGTVGSYFQMLLAAGVLFAYVVGSGLNVFWFSIICGSMPIVFGLSFLYFPETPVYYITLGHVTRARNSLEFFRSSHNNLDIEIIELTEYSGQRKGKVKKNVWKGFLTKQGLKGLSMSIGLMIFQQMCGINAFIFNATDILEKAGGLLGARYETIIIGVMQLIGAFVVTVVVDKVGRILMLEISAISMSCCTFFLGMYFYLLEKKIDLRYFLWIPVVSLSVFVVMFSVGFGAVPWMMMPELMPADIKGPGISIACISNWVFAFLVTRFFSDLIDICGMDITFFIFCVISIGATVFAFKVLPETKGKSFEQIQQEMGEGINLRDQYLHGYKNGD